MLSAALCKGQHAAISSSTLTTRYKRQHHRIARDGVHWERQRSQTGRRQLPICGTHSIPSRVPQTTDDYVDDNDLIPRSPLEEIEPDFPEPYHEPNDALLVEEDGQVLAYERVSSVPGVADRGG